MPFDPTTAKPLSAYAGADAATSDAMDATDKAGGVVDVSVGADGKVTNNSTAKGQFNPATAKLFNPATAKLVTAETPKPEVPAAGDLNPQLGAAQGALAMGSGMLAKPISDIFGLAATLKDIVSGTDGDPQGFKKMIQDAMTYEPPSKTGKAVAEYNPIALVGKGVNAVAGGVKNLVAPEKTSGPIQSAIGNMVEEAVNQAPSFVGSKAGSITESVAGSAKNLARDTMQSALKPPLKSLEDGTAGKAIDTLLNEGVNVTRGGVGTLQDRVGVLNDKISTAIENSPAVVNKSLVATRLQSALDKFEKQVTPMSDIAAIQRSWNEFMEHPLLDKITPAKTVESTVLDASGKPFTKEIPASGSENIPVQLAQELKQGTYRALGDKSYGELKGADITSQKALARGLKEEIAAAVPEVRPLNAQESQLLNALSLTERRVLMEANRNPIGMGWLTTNPAKFGAWMADRSGLFKSIVARMLNTGSDALSTVAPIAEPAGAAVSADAAKEKRTHRK